MVISVFAMLLVWGSYIRALHWLVWYFEVKKNPKPLFFPGQIIALKTYLQFVLALAKQSVKITFKLIIPKMIKSPFRVMVPPKCHLNIQKTDTGG